MSWHVGNELLAAYREGHLDDTASLSVEAHMIACDGCQRSMSDAVDPERRRIIWEWVVDSMDRPVLNPAERVLGWLGVPAHVARLLVMTPSIRASWLFSVLTVLLFALFASRNLFGDPILFLAVAPLVPVLGIAVSFGHRIDPLYEVGLASPLGGFRLMLIRASAVLMASVALSAVPALFLAEIRWMVVWLVPALVVTVLTLVISTFTSTSWAAGVVSGLWLGGVALVEMAADTRLAAFSSPAQVTLAAIAVGLTAVLLVRRQAFEYLGQG